MPLPNPASRAETIDRQSEKVVLLYSRQTQRSRDLLAFIEDNRFKSIDKVCVDAAEIREKIEQSTNIRVRDIPSVIITYDNKDIEVLDGQAIYSWFNTMLRLVQRTNPVPSRIEGPPQPPDIGPMRRTPIQSSPYHSSSYQDPPPVTSPYQPDNEYDEYDDEYDEYEGPPSSGLHPGMLDRVVDPMGNEDRRRRAQPSSRRSQQPQKTGRRPKKGVMTLTTVDSDDEDVWDDYSDDDYDDYDTSSVSHGGSRVPPSRQRSSRGDATVSMAEQIARGRDAIIEDEERHLPRGSYY